MDAAFLRIYAHEIVAAVLIVIIMRMWCWLGMLSVSYGVYVYVRIFEHGLFRASLVRTYVVWVGDRAVCTFALRLAIC